MKTQSKQLFILTTVALLIFISAFIWKQYSVDNSETITVNTSSETPNNKQTKKQIPVDDISIQKPVEEFTDKTEKKKVLEKKLNHALMLQTPEQIMELINTLQEQGKDEEVDEYIEYLLERFPDYKFE